MNTFADVRALFFDVFGTLVDFRSSVAREAESILGPQGHVLDWPALADAWRAEYQPAMEDVRAGRQPYCKLDVLHRRNLERILPRFNVQPLDDATLDQLTLAWHRLDAWPDAAPGLIRLKSRYRLAPVSNGNISLMVDLARRNGFPLGRHSGRGYRAQFQTQAASLSRGLRVVRSRPAAMHDGCRAFERSGRPRCTGIADSACGAA